MKVKTLGALLLFFMVFGFASTLKAQSQEKSPTVFSDADRAILQSWAEQANQSREAKIENGRLILPVDPHDGVCAFLRVYRMKRDDPRSDATRPSGYTTCVNSSQFTMKSSTAPSTKTPIEN